MEPFRPSYVHHRYWHIPQRPPVAKCRYLQNEEFCPGCVSAFRGFLLGFPCGGKVVCVESPARAAGLLLGDLSEQGKRKRLRRSRRLLSYNSSASASARDQQPPPNNSSSTTMMMSLPCSRLSDGAVRLLPRRRQGCRDKPFLERTAAPGTRS